MMKEFNSSFKLMLMMAIWLLSIAAALAWVKGWGPFAVIAYRGCETENAEMLPFPDNFDRLIGVY